MRPPAASELHTGDGLITNVSVQEICSLDASDHITLALANATGYRTRDGRAVERRARQHGPGRRGAGCAQPAIPGYNPARLAAMVGSYFNNRDVGADRVSREPPLRCYVTGPCPGGSSRLARLRLTVRPRRVPAGRPVRLRVRVRARVGGRLRPVRGVLVRVAGRRKRMNGRGRLVVRVRFAKAGRRSVRARAPGFLPGRTTVVVRRRR